MSPFFDVAYFMEACGQTTGEPNVRQLGLYIGMQCEELAEKLAILLGKGHGTVQDLDYVGHMFKAGDWDHSIKVSLRSREDVKAMVDADFDLQWVSIAATLSLGARVHEAWDEGARSNLAKIDPKTGAVLRDPVTGKVQKPEGWRPPDFGVCL